MQMMIRSRPTKPLISTASPKMMSIAPRKTNFDRNMISHTLKNIPALLRSASSCLNHATVLSLSSRVAYVNTCMTMATANVVEYDLVERIEV